MKIKISIGEKIFIICNYIFLTLLMLCCIYPFWHALMASFSDSEALLSHVGFLWKPIGFNWEAYKVLFKDNDVLYGLKNSLFLLSVGVPLQLLMTSLAAYFLSRENVLWKHPLLIFFMLTMYVSGGTIPYYLNLVDLHLTESLWGLIIPGLVSTWNVIILKTSFESVPLSLCDAARIDGAGHLRTMVKVVVPLSKASMAVIALWYGLGLWNDWFWASIIIRKNEMMPLQVILRDKLVTSALNGLDESLTLTLEGLKYSTMIVSILPILLVYPFMQKHFTKGVMIGAVKG